MKKALLFVCAIICSIGISYAQTNLQPFKWEVKYCGEVSVGVAISNEMKLSEYKTDNAVESLLARPVIETVHGVSLSDYMSVGLGVGFQLYAGTVDEFADYIKFRDNKNTWGMIAIPVFVNVKGSLPLDNDFKPFTTLSLGRTQMASSYANLEEDNTKYVYDVRVGTTTKQRMNGGFYCDWGVGFEYKMCSLSFGLQHQRYTFKEVLTTYSFDPTVVKENKERMYSNSFYFKVGVSF